MGFYGVEMNARLSAQRRKGMRQKVIQNILKQKALILIICTIGIVAVSYGMAKDNNVIFVLGIGFIIGGYLLIRKGIKERIKNGP
jgi:vacuolar-type H+-ATPase subunit I/STV1